MVVLADTPSLASHFLAELRDVRLQADRPRFRRNLVRMGELMAYELSKTMDYAETTVQTPLGKSDERRLGSRVVLATVLRASLPFYQGFLNLMDQAESAFVGAYRGPQGADGSFGVEMDYLASPDLTGKTLILLDPMLATGRSLVDTYRALLAYGTPAGVHVAAVIASPEGVVHVQEHLPGCRLWLGAVDSHLNEKYYIVPGLGDAGDLAFGPKL